MTNNRQNEIRKRLPYGLWTCADGRLVLFDRDYIALVERRPGPDQKATIADPTEWVPWVAQEWFYDDASIPRQLAPEAGRWLAQWNATELALAEATRRAGLGRSGSAWRALTRKTP